MARPSSADLSRLHVLLPVRGLDDGKARLGMALDAEERETLIVGLLVSTLSVLSGWPACRAAHVISGDERVLALARRNGGHAIADTDPSGLNAALRLGRDTALADGATAVLCLPTDLPMLSPAALERLLNAADAAVAAGNGRPVVVAAPSDARGGTNALLLSPPDAIDPSFGDSSLAAHVTAAARTDASVQLVVDPDLGFDLDTPDDLERVEAGRLVELVATGTAALAELDAVDAERAAERVPAADAR